MTRLNSFRGRSGAGKSQTITAIISNALANKKNVLLVCKKEAALKVVARYLQEAEMGDFISLIDNVNSDRRKIVERAREIYENHQLNQSNRQIFNGGVFRSDDYESLNHDYQEEIAEYNNKHQETLKNVIGNIH